MRRRQIVVGLLALGVALATAGLAAAANGGFTPQHAHSPNAHHINTAYYVILGFTAAIFLLVETALVVFIWKYRARSRSRTHEGMQVHGNTRLEVIWTVIPVVILAIIGTVVFFQLPHLDGPGDAAAAGTLQIRVEAHQFYWQFDYPDGTRTINDLYVPVGQEVELKVVATDVVHSWWVPQLGGKIQAIPGRTNTTWFKADRAGTYYGQCAELCGPFHQAMKARVIAVDGGFDAALRQQTKNLGRAEYQGVCSTCHGMKGEGGYGPALSSSSLVTQRASIEQIVRNGRNLMPPVGDTWTDEQIEALVRYTKAHVYKGAATSGG